MVPTGEKREKKSLVLKEKIEGASWLEPGMKMVCASQLSPVCLPLRPTLEGEQMSIVHIKP